MFTAEIRFRFLKKADGEAVSDGVSKLITSWQRNGQVLSEEWPIVANRNTIRAFVLIPERTSLQRKLDSTWVVKNRERLSTVGLSQPAISILGRDPAALDPCRCRKPSGFILYTQCYLMELPLRCADCFDPVPFYRIPHTSDCGTYEDIIFWRRDYQRCDELQMACRVGKRFCTRQMSLPDSELSRQGIACCRRIAEVTKKPCYYYLYRYYGRSTEQEVRRRCPSCGRAWWLSEAWHTKFDFRCDRCHLLSNLAYSVP